MNALYIAHSAKGTTWGKHKYIKKVGNRYYYADDLARGKRKAQAEYLSRYNVQKVQKKYEQNNEEGRAWRNGLRDGEHIYFDADHPNDPEITNMNMQAVRDGDWHGYANEDMRNAVRWNNEVKNIEKEQKRADATRTNKEKFTLKAFNASVKASENIKKGKKKAQDILSKLFKKK